MLRPGKARCAAFAKLAGSGYGPAMTAMAMHLVTLIPTASGGPVRDVVR
jgi:hypothetical protein